MKVGLLGYGKMGKTIDGLSAQYGVEVIWRIGKENRDQLDADLIRKADVVIEFSNPSAAFDNVTACIEAGVPVVSGTTGWLTQFETAKQNCIAHQGALLWASNFSVGVNLFFALNRYLSRLMSAHDEYQPSISETHHIHKLDAPSGTAVSLALDLLAEKPALKGWSLPPAESDQLLIEALRIDETPGTHTIRWQSPIDDITIEHKAHSRQGFAAGALIAAKWILGKKGVFTMNDVLGID